MPQLPDPKKTLTIGEIERRLKENPDDPEFQKYKEQLDQLESFNFRVIFEVSPRFT